MFLTHSWHSLSKCARIWHMCALWHDKQCCWQAISTCFTKKSTFHFLSANSPTFCEAATESIVQNGTDNFFHIVDIILCTITKRYSFLSSLPFSGQLNGFLPIQLEMTKIWTTSAIYLARYFLGISFLESQLVISS